MSMTTPELSLTGDRWIRASAVTLMLIVATSAAILSWSGLTYLAVQSGINPDIAWLLAVAIDGSLILGSMETVHATLTRRSPSYGWWLTFVGVGLSVYGNVTATADDGLQASFVHAIAPCVLFLSVEGLVRILKFRIAQNQEALEEATRAAEREERRRQRAEEKAGQQEKSVKRTSGSTATSTTSRATTAKASATDVEVSEYRDIMDALPADSTKTARVEAVLRAHPTARNIHLSLAMGLEAKAINTTIVRVREKLQKEQSEGEQFQEIVKGLVPASE